MKKWLIGAFVALSFSLFSQNLELGVTIGGSIYRGDIDVNLSNGLQQMRIGGGIFGRYHTSSSFAVRGQLLFATLYADEKLYPSSDERAKRGLSFSSNVVELAVLPEWRAIKFGSAEVYVFAGAAATYFNPTPNFNEPNLPFAEGIVEDKATAFSHIALAIPVGAGIQFFLDETTALGFEVGGRLATTDYLDGISKVANPKQNDYYAYGGLTFSKFFGVGSSRSQRGGGNRGGVNCPSFR